MGSGSSSSAPAPAPPNVTAMMVLWLFLKICFGNVLQYVLCDSCIWGWMVLQFVFEMFCNMFCVILVFGVGWFYNLFLKCFAICFL